MSQPQPIVRGTSTGKGTLYGLVAVTIVLIVVVGFFVVPSVLNNLGCSNGVNGPTCNTSSGTNFLGNNIVWINTDVRTGTFGLSHTEMIIQTYQAPEVLSCQWITCFITGTDYEYTITISGPANYNFGPINARLGIGDHYAHSLLLTNPTPPNGDYKVTFSLVKQGGLTPESVTGSCSFTAPLTPSQPVVCISA